MTAIIVLERPKTASFGLLLLFTSLFVAQVIVIAHTLTSLTTKNWPLALVPVAALAGIVVVLNMPLRDPTMPKEDISPVFSTPTIKLRTPEDDLTPWQYMTVAWMAPLIREGYKRQLDDEDIWDLPWEFKHARLHNTFRKLPGSVTKRVFVANGMDVIRICTLDLLRLAASKFHLGEHLLY